MDEPPVIAQARPGKSVFVVWVLLAGLVAFVFTGLVGYFLFFQARPRSSNSVTGRLVRTLAPSKFSFLDIPESTVAGRYKWTDGPSEFFMVLYDDHTFMNRDGTTFPQYRWDIGPDGLSIQWLSSSSRFTNIESPGVYTSVTTKGTTARMEKLPPYNPSQLVTPKPIASIRLGGQSQTNGLIPVNTGADGEIFPGSVGGVECYQIVRKDDRPAGYLYLQIVPELKNHHSRMLW